MKTYRGVDEQTLVSLTPALFEVEWSASRPCHFTPREGDPGTHWIGGWVSPRASLDDMDKLISCPYRDSNSDPSVVQLVASRYADSATVALFKTLKTPWSESASELYRPSDRGLSCKLVPTLAHIRV
jgi:hypothetical protein